MEKNDIIAKLMIDTIEDMDKDDKVFFLSYMIDILKPEYQKEIEWAKNELVKLT